MITYYMLQNEEQRRIVWKKEKSGRVYLFLNGNWTKIHLASMEEAFKMYPSYKIFLETTEFDRIRLLLL